MRSAGLLRSALVFGIPLIFAITQGYSQEATPENRYALVIGVAGYPNYPSDKQLRFSDNDAQEFADFIESDAGGAFAKDNVRLLRNSDATRDNISREIGWLSRRVTGSDLIYIFFAGHGEVDDLGRVYLMPFDADPKLPEARGLRADRFLDDVKASISAKHMVFFIDACHAGAALVASATTGTSRGDLSPNLRSAWDGAFKGIDIVSLGFFAAGSGQVSWEDEALKHGLFTAYLLKGMRGAADLNKDGVVTAQELYRYTLDKVEEHSRRQYEKQTPIVSSTWEPDFPFAVYGTGKALQVSSGGPKPNVRAGSPLRSQSFRQAHASHEFESIRHEPAKLTQFLREMPKGADLHSHLSGAVYAESLIEFAAKDGLCVDVASETFFTPPVPVPCSAGRLPAPAVLSDVPLYEKLIDAFSMRNFQRSQESPEDHFFAAFGKFGLASSNHVPEMIAEARSRAAKENLQYVELMVSSDFGEIARVAHVLDLTPEDDLAHWREQLMAAGLGAIVSKAKIQWDNFEHSVNELLHCNTPRADPGCFVQTRYLSQVARGMPRQLVFAQLLFAFERASTDSRFVGLNLAMREDWPVPMRDFAQHMQMLAYLRSFYPAVHISLHAGELDPGSSSQDHVRKSLELGHAERIGHGTDVAYEENSADLVKKMAQSNVAVEICLSSDDLLLGIHGGEHPFRLYMDNGVPIVLATNDAGVLRITISQEYRRAAETYQLTYMELKQLARTSLEHSFLPGRSLWVNLSVEEMAEACATELPDPNTPVREKCSQLLAASEKAAAEWGLEQKFYKFESQF